MLPSAHRLCDAGGFRHTVRRGRKASGPSLVVYATRGDEPTRVGFIIAKSVGGAVVRNRVKRRLRHLMKDRLAVLSAGTTLVVRALPAASGRSTSELALELDKSLRRVVVSE